MDQYIGTTLNHSYLIKAVYRQGNSTVIYEAENVLAHIPIAVKMLRPEEAGDEKLVRWFYQKSKELALLSHPNILKTYDANFIEKNAYAVMEYPNGITLADYMDKEKVLAWKDTVHIIRQILSALQYVHERGLTHRYLNPQSIVLFESGAAKVGDFGMLEFASGQNPRHAQVYYNSPEHKGDEREDIFAVGMMLYEMLTGQKPYRADYQGIPRLNNPPDRLCTLNPAIEIGLEEIVLRAIEYDPEKRYQTVVPLINDLNTFQEDTTTRFGYYNGLESIKDDFDHADFYIKEFNEAIKYNAFNKKHMIQCTRQIVDAYLHLKGKWYVLERETEKLKEQNSTLQTDNKKLLEDKGIMLDLSDRLQNEIDSLKNQPPQENRELEALQLKYTELQAESEALKERNTILQAQNTRLKVEKSAADHHSDILHKKLETLQAQYAQPNPDVQRLEEECRTLRTALEQLQKQHKAQSEPHLAVGSIQANQAEIWTWYPLRDDEISSFNNESA